MWRPRARDVRTRVLHSRARLHSESGDIERIALRSNSQTGTPVLVRDVGRCALARRFAAACSTGTGRGSSWAIVVMRYGENALEVIERIKQKIDQLKPGFPEGVELEIAYDRSGLITRSIETLKHALFEEAIVVSLVIVLFLLHVRSSLLPILSLPISVALSFIPMYLLDIHRLS